MPNPSFKAEQPGAGPADDGASQSSSIAPEVLARRAARIAGGEEPFPVGLDLVVEQDLLEQVRRWRRARLLTFLARRVALDIHRRSAQAGAEE